MTKRNTKQFNTCRTLSRISVPQGLLGVRQAAKKDKKLRFNALLHHVTTDLLRESYLTLKKKAAPGIDEVTWYEYGDKLTERLTNLHERIQRGVYKAKPAKRAYIPKPDGKKRPLGIAALEDKIVQGAVTVVLNMVYEEDFKGFSYGFRPKRSAHHALDALWMGLSWQRINYVLDADIRTFFDTINHEWMIKIIEHRIADRRVIKLICKWLKAGVIEKGIWRELEEGTPQGSGISPLLANIYLHYVLDLWIEQWRRRRARGNVIIVRYADDYVLGFQRWDDAKQCYRELGDRLVKFGLSLNQDKTRLIEFGKYAHSNRIRRGAGKPETFEFLGFTHMCSITRTGRFIIKRKTIAKRMTAKLKNIKKTLMLNRHKPIPVTGEWLRRVVKGYFNYHAVPFNSDRINRFRTQVCRYWFKAIKRRGQKDRMTWVRFDRITRYWIPAARILHPYPNERIDVCYSK